MKHYIDIEIARYSAVSYLVFISFFEKQINAVKKSIYSCMIFVISMMRQWHTM